MQYWQKSLRLDGWDYRTPWFYFITVCTKNRKYYLGEIKNGRMGLSEQGCAAWFFWNQIPNHFDKVKLDSFIVMPNHVHGIIQILPDENGLNPVASCNCKMPQEKIREFGKPKAGSLSMILNNYKGAVTRWCNLKGYEFKWQPRFHDHIIRNEKSLNRIREYIEYNPLNWEKDSKNVM
ncbi:transposase [Gracilimonas sp. BCB1]|uniref:transposase n=1 Tax=Gracilimonas sp. BCB1 TaxID=3152362 RepID=UPI0032D90982